MQGKSGSRCLKIICKRLHVRDIISGMERRDFLSTGLAATLATLAPRTSIAAEARIEILPNEPIGTIKPDIYGHFTEHLGGCIYDGIWVGEKSKIPNYGGIRKEFVDQLKKLKPPVIRWPGGCFADSYNWRDGVGPRDARPTRTNFWADNSELRKAPDGPYKYDPNQFGSNDFARLCKMVGAEPYFAANLRSLPAKDFYEWIEYCNSPAGSTTLAKLREQGGSKDPFPVKFWGVGNESWGCGGNFTGDEYAIEFRKFTEWVPRFDVNLAFIASGPNGFDYNWTRSFFSKLIETGRQTLNRCYGTALHFYCGTTGKGNSTEFTKDEWSQLLARSNRMEELISNHWQIMGETDREHRVKLVVDEWGAWHHTDPSIGPGFLWAYYPTLRDALVSGITLDTFNRHADKVVMGNAAQLINNIHTSFITTEDKFTVTPVFHVFEMYAAHQGNTAIRCVITSPGQTIKRPGTAPESDRLGTLTGSCSMQGKSVVLTVVNSNPTEAIDAEIGVQGTRFTGVKATVLTDSKLNAHNNFANPKAIEPKVDSKATVGAPMIYRFAAASVTKLELQLA